MSEACRIEWTPHVRIADVRRGVALWYGLSEQDLMAREHVLARQIAMALSVWMAGASTSVVGRHFGGRHRGTVRNACRQVRARMESESGFRAFVRLLEQAVARGAAEARS